MVVFLQSICQEIECALGTNPLLQYKLVVAMRQFTLKLQK